jgi:hypothetical protein
MFLNYEKIDFTFISQILSFNKEFGKYTSNYGLLCIIHYVSNCNYHHFIKRDNVHFLEIYTTSPSNGKEFEKEQDNKYLYDIILSTYQFDLNEIENVKDINHQEELVKESNELEQETESNELEPETESNELELVTESELDELEPERGRMNDEVLEDCSIFCQLALYD